MAAIPARTRTGRADTTARLATLAAVARLLPQPCAICRRPTTDTITIREQWRLARGLLRLAEPLIEPRCAAHRKGDCRTRYVTDRQVRARQGEASS